MAIKRMLGGLCIFIWDLATQSSIFDITECLSYVVGFFQTTRNSCFNMPETSVSNSGLCTNSLSLCLFLACSCVRIQHIRSHHVYMQSRRKDPHGFYCSLICIRLTLGAFREAGYHGHMIRLANVKHGTRDRITFSVGKIATIKVLASRAYCTASHCKRILCDIIWH